MNIQAAAINRQIGHIENDAMPKVHAVRIGAGRDHSGSMLLAAMGVKKITIIDPGYVEPENINQSGFTPADLGQPKAVALANCIMRACPDAKVTAIVARHDEVPNLADLMASADLTSDGADSLHVSKDLARLAWETNSNVLHVRSTGDSKRFIIVGTLARYKTPGCIRCRMKSAFDTLEQGYSAPPFFRSYRLVPERLNIYATWVTMGLLHTDVGSKLPIAAIGERFRQHPAWIGLNDIDPMSGEIFPIKEYRETVPSDWTCPVCGAGPQSAQSVG
jgi:molybdopterin/thiamine biosynthesis adenylyltransferase